MDLRKLENDLFDIEIQDEISMAPMRSYIEEWFQRRMDKLIDKGQQLVGTILVVVDDNNKKRIGFIVSLYWSHLVFFINPVILPL